MTPSTASRNLWTMNPSHMSYRNHGKPRLLPFPYTQIYLVGPYSYDLSIHDCLTGSIHHPAMECATPPFLSSCLVVSYRCVVACVPSFRAG